MKKLWQSFTLATAMYSKLPMPRVAWGPDAMAHVFCFFPWIGLVIGALELGWFWLAARLGVGRLLFGAVAALLPLAVTGGIHLDGFCDTCDALGSHQSRERMLEILKDSHTGAFALIGLGCYLTLDVALWAEARPCWALALVPVLSRVLSGFCAVTMPNARGSGMLASFSQSSDLRRNRAALALWLLALGAAAGLLPGWEGVAVLAAGLVSLAWYRRMSQTKFGGITGDLEGWFLQICELVCLAAVALCQKVAA